MIIIILYSLLVFFPVAAAASFPMQQLLPSFFPLPRKGQAWGGIYGGLMNVDISLTLFLLPSLQMAVIPPPAPLAASSLLLHLFKKGLGLGAYLGGQQRHGYISYSGVSPPPLLGRIGQLPLIAAVFTRGQRIRWRGWHKQPVRIHTNALTVDIANFTYCTHNEYPPFNMYYYSILILKKSSNRHCKK